MFQERTLQQGYMRQGEAVNDAVIWMLKKRSHKKARTTKTEYLEQVAFLPRLQAMLDEGRTEMQQVCKPTQDSKPVGIRLTYALTDSSDDNAKMHRKRQAWDEKKQKAEYTKKQLEDCETWVE